MLSLLSLVTFVTFMLQLELELELTTLGEMNALAIGILLSTVLLPVFALGGLSLSVLTWKRESAVVAKTRCLLGSLGASCIALFFASVQGFALRIWQW